MGIYDRDYYRGEGPSFLGGITNQAPAVKWLILINILFFLVQLATIEHLPGRGRSDGAFTKSLWLDPGDVAHGQVWRLLTSAFLHSTLNPWHILINMFVLWWAGKEMEETHGTREFLTFYLLGAIFSGIVYTATMLPLERPPPAVGASGAVTATLVLFACHYPHRTILLMLIIPVPAWMLVVLLVGHDFFIWAAQHQTGIAVTGHLGGALFGWLYFKNQWKLSTLWSSFRARRRTRARPKLRLYHEDEPAAVGAATAPAPPPRAPAERDIDEHLEARLDAVLEKMSLVGKDNLTEDEKEILLRASEIYKRRRT
jgi:membrane associated rhomboid family serine protease